MVNERHNGNLLVQLGPSLQACPQELLRQRRGRDGQPEYLIQWSVVSLEERAAEGSSTSSTESKPEKISLWMSAEEVCASCPALLGKRKLAGQWVEEAAACPLAADVPGDQEWLLEMKADVRSLVRRAGRQMAETGAPEASILNTVHVLSAYASIGSLAEAFREAGALDLLMKMLCHQEKEIRHSAGKMLRALASHDAGSWAYVLLSLSQQEGIEQHMDFESRYTLLELFAETTSSEEHCMSFEGIHLPQIPGKLLFVLVKRYLCVTSLLDELGSGTEQGGEQQQQGGAVASPVPEERSRLKQEFELNMAMASLILELAHAVGWEQGQRPEPPPRPVAAHCIFQRRAATAPPRTPSACRPRSAPSSRSGCAEHVRAHTGHEGPFCRSREGTAHAQVYGRGLGSACRVHWPTLEMVCAERREETSAVPCDRGPAAAARPLSCEASGGLQSLPAVREQRSRAAEALSRAEWWELLFFVKKLEAEEQKELISLIQQEQGEQLLEVDEEGLLQLSVPAELAQKVLQEVEKRCQGSTRCDLRGSHIYTKYLLAKETLSAAAGPPRAPAAAAKSDAQLFSELLEREGLLLPEVTEERSRVLGSCKGVSERSSLAQVVALVDMVQSRSSEVGLCLDGLKDMLKLLEEEPEQQAGEVQDVLVTRSVGEKVVKVAVELLSSEEAEKALVVVTLRLLAMLLAKHDWRVAFGTEGGVRAVLACMRRHSCSALVQQAGLAALKVLVGAEGGSPGGAGGKPSSLSHGDAQMMREIFASIGSACGESSASLLSAIPAAMSTMQRVPGGSSGVQNGLLVVQMLLEEHRGLAEQLWGCDLPGVLQSCWRDGQGSDCPDAALALGVMNRLAERQLPPGTAGREAPLELGELQLLLGGLGDGVWSKDVVVALERQLCGAGSVPSGQVWQLLREHRSFRLLLRSLELLGAEKAVSLGVLRILNKLLASYQEDVLPWHECVEPCLSSLSAHSSDQEVLQEVVGFLHGLASAAGTARVVMCSAGTHLALSKALAKHSTVPPLAPALLALLTDCEKLARLCRRLSSSILAGCMQLVLGQIEEHRRSQQPISIPFFDVFLRSLCRGSSVEVKEEKCWEKVEVSSNPHRASKLTDRNPKTYWESNGSTGSHFITVHMQRGVVVREMSMLVASEDSSYMPARVVVLGGDSPASVRTELNSVTVLPSDSRVILLENVSQFWPVIQIRVKRCQQGGIDTRVRGIEVLGPKPTLWPIFREQLCRRTFLSCTALAHAWCQEISRDRGQLLQLFGKLNRVLQHEQSFAERFLPEDEVAQALGRTCWEALVKPLVQSITSPDPSGSSPLAWLLTEYLESVEWPGPASSRGAAFGCRVRRLTQLLVHVDPDGPDPGEARAAGGKEGKDKEVPASTARAAVEKSGSLWGISQCWHGVVQQQVQRFLELAGQAPDLVERYCQLYQRLRRATEELFGQQASFLLALGQGFAGALVQLPFLAALHVSEQFARYLDGLVQELCGAAGSLGPPQRLQQILEPFVAIGGLELAHTFEHFYRHYLGDRLLAQGASWLEGAIVEQLGLCFPSRFPQQMLSNLAQSEELQQQFRLFRLQEQDKQLLELAPSLDGAAGTGSVADVPEVKVLTLSPRCWPVSPLCHMDEPGRFFSAALSSPLDEFATFCRHSQAWLGWECTKPRRLQWTWLGHAEVQFGDCILHVSTLQMYILLCFNSAQEVAVETLLQATGLPADLVHHALAPLTHSDGILVGSCTPGAPGVLRLKPEALAHASGPHLRLLPQQRYLQSERADTSVLERKRNVLCCLITRILKVEKQLHIDNLVFRVTDACRKGELGPGLQFLSFCCHSVDVLSCILHLLHQGYIRRQEEKPHVLEYISAEPTTPFGGQAQVVFQGGPPAASPKEDSMESPCWLNPGISGLEEFLVATLQVPMGQTLSPEEAKLLMNQTVQQVQDTLSISGDVAWHLLMHCRWNVDFLIQCYVENSEALLISSGLQVRDSQPPPSPGTHCPVCVNQLCPTEKPPTLCCMHYCCKPCWNEYLTTRIEQNMIVNCTCPISECCAQPTTAFICSIVSSEEIIAKYEKALLRGYVECCSNLTWCTNPQGCDQILLKDGLGYGAACSKCSWISCINCNFPEAHYPASCSHMSQWVDDDGYYEGMTSEAQSKHLAKLISKHCPSCQAQIEKNEGCLHMTCAKCSHGFCWRCLKPWRPTHKDYYNCSAMVSKAAWQKKRFQDYNERCTFHHHAREFAVNLRREFLPSVRCPKISSLTFVLDACKVLEQARKVLAYSCVYSYYNQDIESIDIVEQQTEILELHTNALQILLEETLLQYQDLTSSLRLLKAEHFSAGLEVVRQIKERLFAILWHSTQDFHVGLQTLADSSQRKVELSNVPTSAPACTGPEGSILCDSPNTNEDNKDLEDEYELQWQEDYDDDDDDDDDDLDEDNFLFDAESENLDCDSYFDDEDAYD
ncbi:cullin-9 isoform X2 [Pogoniulus pusillus]|uniref:cullin-9 isoform X2 n=1 Tax=Pogoniulus pusillus TaxID=488313 RepID=UPI0030B99836